MLATCSNKYYTVIEGVNSLFVYLREHQTFMFTFINLIKIQSRQGTQGGTQPKKKNCNHFIYIQVQQDDQLKRCSFYNKHHQDTIVLASDTGSTLTNSIITELRSDENIINMHSDGHSHDINLFSRRPDTFKNTSFFHGIELLHSIVLFVEVSICLFPWL